LRVKSAPPSSGSEPTAVDDARLLAASQLEFYFFQHLTTVALTAVGAVVTFKTIVAQDAAFDAKFLSGLGGLAVTAVLGVFGQEDVLNDLRRVKRRFSLPPVWTRRLSLMTFGLSVGFLLGYFNNVA
jgi:uncharacterized BrkB/YihY/UPF0761 family membrane protein